MRRRRDSVAAMLFACSLASTPALAQAPAPLPSQEGAATCRGGGHTWINWRRYFHDFAPLLFK